MFIDSGYSGATLRGSFGATAIKNGFPGLSLALASCFCGGKDLRPLDSGDPSDYKLDRSLVAHIKDFWHSDATFVHIHVSSWATTIKKCRFAPSSHA